MRTSDDFGAIARQKAALGLNRDAAYPVEGRPLPRPAEPAVGPRAVEGMCPYCYGDLSLGEGRPLDCVGACRPDRGDW